MRWLGRNRRFEYSTDSGLGLALSWISQGFDRLGLNLASELRRILDFLHVRIESL